MRKVSVIAITATYLDMTFATTANITSVVETGGYFVRTVICTIIWASFPMIHVDDMRGDRMRLIDADALEREGWSLHRTFQKDARTMVYETKKPSDFPTIEPERETGKWIPIVAELGDHKIIVEGYNCSKCGRYDFEKDNFCPDCGARMEVDDEKIN